MGDRDEPWDGWIEALGVPEGTKSKKYYVDGFPNAQATDLLPTLATRYRDLTQNVAGSSSSAPRQHEAIPHKVYLVIVRNVLTEVGVNPYQFACQLSMRRYPHLQAPPSRPPIDPPIQVKSYSGIA